MAFRATRLSSSTNRYGNLGENDVVFTTSGPVKPLLVVCHARAATGVSTAFDVDMNKAFAELAENYTVHVSDLGGSVAWGNWGTKNAINQIRIAMNAAFGTTGRIGLLGISMGGLAALNYAMNAGPGDCAFVAGLAPALNLNDLRFYNATNDTNDGSTTGTYNSEINTAYGGTYTEGDYVTQVLADSPLAYYRLGETSGAMLDSSGNSRSGTYASAVVRGVSGAIADGNAAAYFSGNNASAAYASTPYAAWMNPTGGVTVEAWWRSTDTVNNALAGRDGGLNSSYFLRTVSGRPAWSVRAGTASQATVSSSTAFNDGIWHHLVGTWDGTTQALYVDGALVASAALSGSLNTSATDNMRIGINGTFATNSTIDEVAIYGSALSAARIALHNAIGPGFSPWRYRTGYPASSIRTGIWTSPADTVVRNQWADQFVAAQPSVERYLIRNTSGVGPAHTSVIAPALNGLVHPTYGFPRIIDWVAARRWDTLVGA